MDRYNRYDHELYDYTAGPTPEDRLVAVEALVTEWENDKGILSPDSRYTRDVMVREIRRVLS